MGQFPRYLAKFQFIKNLTLKLTFLDLSGVQKTAALMFVIDWKIFSPIVYERVKKMDTKYFFFFTNAWNLGVECDLRYN